MSDTVSLIAAAMRADADALRTVAQNIANAQSVAYRRRIPLAHASFASISATATNAPQVKPDTAIDVQPGTLRRTGESLHAAIDGPGFFTIATAQGDALTRRGDFRVDAQGALVTPGGDAVLGVQGPIVIGDGAPQIDVDGTVRVRAGVAGRLRIVEVADPSRLQPLGEGAFTVPQGVDLLETGLARVRQGFLETSNVSAVGEMIRMMELMRHFETTQRLARSHDDMLSKAISQLGRV